MSVLSAILERKYTEVAGRRLERSESQLEEIVQQLPPPRPLFAALSPHYGPVRVIAEVKRASPSAGAINPDIDAAALAACYAQGGASAISVLTDGPGFGGSIDDLRAACSRVSIPVLRKDFIVERYQLLEAREAGADAVLLIVAALQAAQLRALLIGCRQLGMNALVEVHDASELQLALELGALIVGINNRDLRTFGVDLSVSERLLPLVPPAVRAVAESGIRGTAEVRRLRAAGAANFLVGEALVRTPEPSVLLGELLRVG